MKLLSLVEEIPESLDAEIIDARREDLEIDDGAGGYRRATRTDIDGKKLIRFESKEARRLGLKIVGTSIYCSTLEV